MSLVSRGRRVLADGGVFLLVVKALSFAVSNIRQSVLSILFGIRNGLTENEGAIVIALRESALDSTSLSLLSQCSEEFDNRKIYLVVDSKRDFRASTEGLREELIRHGISFEVVQTDTRELVDTLVRADIYFITSKDDIWTYRRFIEQRRIVRLYHGIITKNYGRHGTPADFESSTVPIVGNVLNRANQYGRTGAKSVQSRVERHFRAAGEADYPSVFKTYGYPQQDRLRAVRQGSESILPAESRDELEESTSSFRILYAPTTYRDYGGPLFPFEDGDPDALRELLDEYNATLYVRMHPTADVDRYRQEVEGDVIREAGTEFSPSSVEILPYFDVLITDYSSIYMEFLPFDRPICFIQDDKYLNDVGIAFEYDRYFPGPKARTFEELLADLESVMNSEDDHANDRKFVRRTFLQNRESTFLESYVTDSDQSFDSQSSVTN